MGNPISSEDSQSGVGADSLTVRDGDPAGSLTVRDMGRTGDPKFVVSRRAVPTVSDPVLKEVRRPNRNR